MTVYLATYDKDMPATLRLVRWMAELDKEKKHELVIVADAGTNYWDLMGAVNIARTGPFGTVRLVATEHPVKGWIAGSNTLWLRAAEHAEASGVPYWLFIEPDAVPLCSGWIDSIEKAFRAQTRAYMGSLVPHEIPGMHSPYLEGCAVYPGKACSELKPLVNMEKSWTLTTAAKVVPQAVNSLLFQHLWGEKDQPPMFAQQGVPGTRVFGLDYLRSNAVLFHRAKGPELIDLLRQRLGLCAPVPQLKRRRYLTNRTPVTVQRAGAIGDVLCASTVCEKLLAQGVPVRYQVGEATHCVMRRHQTEMVIAVPSGTPQVNLDGAYEQNIERRKRHFHEMFFAAANTQLAGMGISLGQARNCTPRLIVELNDRVRELQPYPRPWVFICPKSQSFANRSVPDVTWREAARRIQGTCFWVGMGPGPAGIVDLTVRHLDRLIELMANADLLLTTDTGPMHIAAALRVPTIVVNQASFAEQHLSDQNDFRTISTGLACLNCQDSVCKQVPAGTPPPCQNISPESIAEAANARLAGKDKVSVVVSIYRPAAARLNRCLAAVLSQAHEIVVVRDLAGAIPVGALQHPKIQYVLCPKTDIGYGRKVNYGARHTNGSWIWTLNDDCYVQPNTLQRLREVAKDDVGIAAHELRYPNGMIQHGGTYRNPGDIGWGHLDHNASVSRIKEPVEMENVTGASALFRREAFYAAKCFDEDFYLYCEDNAMCLQVRQAGWKIMYTPHAKAVHEEHQSTKTTANMQNHLRHATATLAAKWGKYFQHNLNRVPGNFDY